MDVKVLRQLLDRALVKLGQLLLLLGGTTRCYANDMSGLVHFVGKEKEEEGLPVLGGGAGCAEGRVVGWEFLGCACIVGIGIVNDW